MNNVGVYSASEFNMGFTLIELLVVIAIIAIFLAFFIPNLLNSRKAANNNAALTFTRNAVGVAESKRAAAGDVAQYPIATNCVPDIYPNLMSGIRSCQARQDGNSSYILVQSEATGQYFYFDGETIQGPLNSAPTSW